MLSGTSLGGSSQLVPGELAEVGAGTGAPAAGVRDSGGPGDADDSDAGGPSSVVSSAADVVGELAATTAVISVSTFSRGRLVAIHTVRSLACHTATGTHIAYKITQCYLPPDRCDIPAFTPAEAGIRLSDPGGMQG